VSALFRFFVERHMVAWVITAMIVLLGGYGLTVVQRDQFPQVDFGEIYITTTYPGASPEDVELKVTNLLEDELEEVTGLDRLFSWSMEDVSLIGLRIDSDVSDPDSVKTDIREAVGRVTDLPVEVTESPMITELDTAILPVIEVGLSGDVPYTELRELARRFEKKLKAVPGVTSVERFGYRDREVRVAVDPERAAELQVPLREVMAAIATRNVRATGGTFESYTSAKNIVTLAQFETPQQVGDVIIRTTFDGPSIKVKDLARITDGFEEETVLSRMNGKPAISFLAHKSANADILRTVEGIHTLVNDEQARLPEGVTLHFFNDTAVYVKNRLDIVTANGLMGLALVFLVLTVFLSRRIAFWVALGVPVSLMGVIFLLPLFGCYLDSVTLTAMVLVLGIIVDDAIIIAESIYRRFERGDSPVEAAVGGIQQVIKPVITTVLTTLVAFAPLFFMPGMLGKFVYVIPLVITLALCISMVESTLALPAHLAAGLAHARPTEKGGDVPGGTEGRKRHLFVAAGAAYLKLARPLFRFRYLTVLASMLVLAGALGYAVRFMDFVLFPSNTADRFVIFVDLPEGASLAATSDRVRLIESRVLALGTGELDSFATRIGTSGDIVAPLSENTAGVWVALTPFSERERTADQIVEHLRKQTDALPGFEKIVYQIDSGGPPVGRPITLRVVSSNDAERTALADRIVADLKGMPGVKDVDRDDKPGKEQVAIRLNYEALARSGLTVADVAQNVRIAYDGEVVTRVRYGDEDVDFRVIFPASAREKPDYLNGLQIPNDRGRMIPLSRVARLETGPSPSNFFHWKGERSITVTADVDKAVTTPLKATAGIMDTLNLERDAPGARVIVGGEAQESEQAMRDLFLIFAIAIVGMYFLLLLLFGSLWQPLMVLAAVPFAIIGVIIAFALHGEPMGFLAMTGLVGLAGVAVNDSLVLVHHVNQLRRKHPDRPLLEIVLSGTVHRLRAIVITTVTTVAGLLPLAYGLGGADPYMGPMALALGWGLMFATPLTLVLVPSLYLIGEDVTGFVKGDWRRRKRVGPEAVQ